GQPHHPLRHRIAVADRKRADLLVSGGPARGASPHRRRHCRRRCRRRPQRHADPFVAQPGALSGAPRRAEPTEISPAMPTEFDIRFAIDPQTAAGFGTADLRRNFLVEGLFTAGVVRWSYSHYDRMTVGSAVPADDALALEPIKPTGTPFFLERREMIAVNNSAAGTIRVDGDVHVVGPRVVTTVGSCAHTVHCDAAGAKSCLLAD